MDGQTDTSPPHLLPHCSAYPAFEDETRKTSKGPAASLRQPLPHLAGGGTVDGDSGEVLTTTLGI